MEDMKALPVVYSCSGCSSAGQMANTLALRLDREGLAEMSCIAGVGGGVAPLVAKAKAAERVIAIDGCPLHCALHSLRSRGVEPAVHVDLAKRAVRKLAHQDPDAQQAQQVYLELADELQRPPALLAKAEAEVQGSPSRPLQGKP